MPGQIAIAWHGLPYYAFHCIESILSEFRPSFLATPGPAIEAAANYPHFRLLGGEKHSGWQNLGLPVPLLFFQTGWGYPLFNRLGEEVRQKGGKVVTFVDNNRKHNLRQLLGFLYYRIYLHRHFSAAWVPGASAAELMRFFGCRQIYRGLYSAGPEFTGRARDQRLRRLLYAGQFIERKAVQPLCDAFLSLEGTGWELWLVGQGPLKLEEKKNVHVMPFQPPDMLAHLMRESSWFVLPSYEEHWGVVVHEAALSGCALILRRSIGSVPDLADDENALFFDHDEELPEVLAKAMQMEAGKLKRMSEASTRRAAAFSIERWRKTFHQIVQDLLL